MEWDMKNDTLCIPERTFEKSNKLTKRQILKTTAKCV